ncbi:hypothetical protein BJ508DRAFT_329797 [Ascobolus immersus RN42]|uniref:Uncharacterized protein n=1 Tax=Ascobolus immersus RN42 TaxID=1160509 RepID=A0A3N4HVN6_ASCIM|nr:hypothetical protein BJ508DRAFT_329797 [Ascobolus immersus RN42]
MPPLRHTARTLKHPHYNPYDGRREKKPYRYGRARNGVTMEVKTKVDNEPFLFKLANNQLKNAINASYNFTLGNDDPIRPYINPVEGKAAPRGRYPRTKNEVALFTPHQWEVCGRSYNFNWNISPALPLEAIRNQWRGLTGTHIHN